MGESVHANHLIKHDNLEEFSDPPNYDMEDPSDTGVAFYSSLAQETGGPVLELACGTGRVCIPIARQGHSVTGLDIVPGMLEQARRKSTDLPIRWLEGDARTFEINDQFRLIFLTGNAFQAFLTNTDQEALLSNVRAHLHDEGLFAFETRNPLLDAPLNQAGQFVPLGTHGQVEPWSSFTSVDGHEIRLSKKWSYDHVTQILHWTTYRRWLLDGKEQTKVTRIALRYTFPQELAALLHYNGFDVVRQYGDWTLEPLAADSPSIIVVCRVKTGAIKRRGA